MSTYDPKVANTIASYLDAAADRVRDRSYDTSGVVSYIEDGMAFVRFNGSSVDTPVEQTISAKVGDEVKVRVSGRKAWLTGNATEPPSSDASAIEAATKAGLSQITNLINESMSQEIERITVLDILEMMED